MMRDALYVTAIALIKFHPGIVVAARAGQRQIEIVDL
jgi:hypothetical protein